jgi:23S rRNA U2552 (ribose-2'-O)-methylase RlmE/FtsJ
MLGTAWPLVCAATADARGGASGNDALWEALLHARRRVGEHKVRVGETAWREAVDRDSRRPGGRVASRAYYKLVEMVRLCAVRAPATALCLCEAPGGFVQAIVEEAFDPKCPPRWTATTMLGPRTPRFAQNVGALPNGSVLIPGNGDLLLPATRAALVDARPLAGYDLITADGAVDNDARHEDLELLSARLLSCELECALACQARGGTLVVKFFAGRLPVTRRLLGAACRAYGESYVVKPASSRLVNDERYLLCKDFDPQRAPTGPIALADDFDPNGGDAVDDRGLGQALGRLAHDQVAAIRDAIARSTGRAGRAGRRPPVA